LKGINRYWTSEENIMSKKNYIAMMVAAISAAALMSGCSTSGSDIASSNGVRVMYADMRSDAGGTVVEGRLVQTGARTLARNGHLDVQLLDASGKTVSKTCSDPIHMSYRGPGRGLKTRAFTVRVNATAPGGKALVAYHPGHSCDS
jgi:hypothetical protein